MLHAMKTLSPSTGSSVPNHSRTPAHPILIDDCKLMNDELNTFARRS